LAAEGIVRREVGVEVKIGVAESRRELVLNTNQTQDEIEALVTEALKNKQGLLVLVDDKGRRYVVPSTRVTYVEIATADARRVGFAVGAN
jgi:hypothetical protein